MEINPESFSYKFKQDQFIIARRFERPYQETFDKFFDQKRITSTSPQVLSFRRNITETL